MAGAPVEFPHEVFVLVGGRAFRAGPQYFMPQFPASICGLITRQFRIVSSGIVPRRCISPDLSGAFGVPETTVADPLIRGPSGGKSLSVSCPVHDFVVLAVVKTGESNNQVNRGGDRLEPIRHSKLVSFINAPLVCANLCCPSVPRFCAVSLMSKIGIP